MNKTTLLSLVAMIFLVAGCEGGPDGPEPTTADTIIVQQPFDHTGKRKADIQLSDFICKVSCECHFQFAVTASGDVRPYTKSSYTFEYRSKTSDSDAALSDGAELCKKKCSAVYEPKRTEFDKILAGFYGPGVSRIVDVPDADARHCSLEPRVQSNTSSSK